MTIRQRLNQIVRVILKYTLNPFTRRMAKSNHGPFAVVQHIGRRSGKQYETPILVAPLGDDLVIELTYGFDVDWYKNVVAVGGCTILWRGQDYHINHLEPLDAAIGRNAFPFPASLILRVARMKHFVKMTVVR